MIIFACILLFFIFLLTLKATITLEYNSDLSLTLRILFIKIDLLGSKKKKYKQSMSARKAKRIRKKLRKKALKKRGKAEDKKEGEKGKEKKKRSFGDILDIVTLVTGIAKTVIAKTFGHLRLKMTRVRIKIGTGDAATTAITYGAVSQSINVLFALLSEVKRVKLPEPDDIDVCADFLAEKSDIDIKISFSLRVWHVIHIACAALSKLVKRMIDNEKKKAGN